MKIIKLSLLFFVIANSVLSCKQNSDTTVLKTNQSDTLEKCSLTENVALSMELVKKDVETFRKANSINDNCYLALIDTLTVRFIKTSDIQYMICLELISNVRDGYVSEYFPEIGQKLYHENFKGFFNYIYKKRDSMSNSMREVFIESVAYEIKYEKNRDKLYAYFDSQMEINNFSEKQRKFFDNMMKKAEDFQKQF